MGAPGGSAAPGKRYIATGAAAGVACFCGCAKYGKSPDGFRIECTSCGHGPQNHDDEFRAAARANEGQSQKRDADFG